jgi:glycerol-3-phosphate acyltransferase PlsY
MEESINLALVVGSYLVGSIPFGLLVARLAGAGDVRQQGSGNIGATNVLRTAGKAAGALALLLDMGKGALPVVVAIFLAGRGSFWVEGCGLAAFLGHLFPVYLKFRGGKGVATGLGGWLALMPWVGLYLLMLWLLVAFLFRFSSLAALVAFGLLPSLLAGMGRGHDLPLAVIMLVLIFWKHLENIRRLLAHSEPRIGQKDGPR